MLINRACLDRPAIVLLPKRLAVTGLTDKIQDTFTEYLPQGGLISDFLKRQAREHKTYISIFFASYCRKSKASGIYNSVVLFDRQRRIAGVYDKTFPTIGEMESGVLPGQARRLLRGG